MSWLEARPESYCDNMFMSDKIVSLAWHIQERSLWYRCVIIVKRFLLRFFSAHLLSMSFKDNWKLSSEVHNDSKLHVHGEFNFEEYIKA